MNEQVKNLDNHRVTAINVKREDEIIKADYIEYKPLIDADEDCEVF